MPEMTKERIDEIVEHAYERNKSHNPAQSGLITILQEVQTEIGYLPREALEKTSNLMNVPLSHTYGVATFYHQFRLRPKGKHVITICCGTACHVQGSGDLMNLLRQSLKVNDIEDTTKDGLFTVMQVRCLGACGLAPIIKIDEEFYGKVNATSLPRILNKYRGEST
jgi:NADH:ubiquinone oxidoreductase subunit E